MVILVTLSHLLIFQFLKGNDDLKFCKKEFPMDDLRDHVSNCEMQMIVMIMKLKRVAFSICVCMADLADKYSESALIFCGS